MNDVEERFDQATVRIRLHPWTRVLAYLWSRDIDPGNALVWLGVLAVVGGFWGCVGWAIWKALQ
jgi:hypothetical protein